LWTGDNSGPDREIERKMKQNKNKKQNSKTLDVAVEWD
jgi:hypothetical protein